MTVLAADGGRCDVHDTALCGIISHPRLRECFR
jgi:hypothetical protein